MRESEFQIMLGKCDGIVTLHGTFMDAQNLYFVFPICPYGNLDDLIKHFGK